MDERKNPFDPRWREALKKRIAKVLDDGVESVNGKKTPLASDGMQGIQDAVDNHPLDEDLVLELVGTYSGDANVTLDASPTGGSPRNITVIAHGARIDFSGAEAAFRLIKSNSINDGRIKWLGGYVGGPGSGQSGTKAFELADAARLEIAPDQIDGYDTLVEFRNESQYCEMSHVHNFRATDYNIGVNLLTNTDTGGSGTKSFRGTLIDNLIAESPGDKFITMSTDAALYASEIKHIHGAIGNSTDILVHLQGNQSNTRVIDVRGETGGAATPGTVVKYENISNAPAECRNISTTGSGTAIDIPTTEPFNDTEGMTANRAYFVGARNTAPPTPGDGAAVIWVDRTDFDLKVTFANGSTFTIQTNT